MARVCIGTPGPCCHQGLCVCLGSGPQPVTMLVSEGCATAGARPIWVARVFNLIYGINQTKATAEDHVWVCGHAASRVCVVVCGSETIKDYADAGGLDCHFGLCWCLRAMLLWGSCWYRWPALPPGTMVTFGLRLLPRTISGSVVLPQSGSVLMSVTQVATKGHIDTRDLGCNLWPCGHPRVMLPPGTS